MNRHRAKYAVAFLLAVAALLAACGPKNISANPPTQGGDAYTYCVKAASTTAIAINKAMPLIDQTRQNGLISTQEETAILGYFKFANDADSAFLTCVQAAHSGGGVAGAFTACANTFTASLNNPQELALIHVSNSAGQANVNAIVQGVVAAVNLIVTNLGGK